MGKDLIIRRIVKESIKGILMEDDENLGQSEKKVGSDLKFSIDKCDDVAQMHIVKKLGQLNRVAERCGGKLSIETSDNFRIGKGNDGNKVKIPTIEFVITTTVPEIKVAGYQYLGSVVPMSIMLKDGTQVHDSIVSMSQEFAGYDEYKDIMKKSTMRMVCDGCHRNTDRGIYFCFLEESTGQVKKYGGSCAAKYFGIDVANKVQVLFSALAHLGEEPYLRYIPIGEDIMGHMEYESEKIIGPVMSSIFGVMDDEDMDEFYEKETVACMALVKFGMNCRMKTSLEYGERYFELYKNALAECTSYNRGRKEINHAKFDLLWGKIRKKYPELIDIKDKASNLVIEFNGNGTDFFYSMVPENDFEEKLRNIGLLITGANIQKKQIGKFSYKNFIPYCVQAYFVKTRQGEMPEDQRTKELEPFEGEKEFDVTIDNVDKKVARNGKDYYAVMGVTSNREVVKWFIFSEEGATLKRGDNVHIRALYNERFNSLDRVVIDKPAPEQTDMQQQPATEEPKEEITYPEDGYRFKKYDFTVIKKADTYLIVKDPVNNGEYFISNKAYIRNYAYSYYTGYYDDNEDSWVYKFDLNDVNEGGTIKISGTVESYTKGEKKNYKLTRVMGLKKFVG